MKAILTYHSIDDSRSAISVSAEQWRAHLKWLTGGRVRVLPLTDLVSHMTDAEDAVALTFDDGFANAEDALRTCATEGLPVSVFVVTRYVGRTNAWGGRTEAGIPTMPLLGWSALERLASEGVAIESHTATHSTLTQVTSAALDDEVEGCRREIEARLGVRSAHLAYPYGDVNNAVAARAAGSYRFGHTTDFRMLTASESLMRLPRLDMYYFRAPGVLEAWGSAAFRRRIRAVRMRRRIRASARGVFPRVR